MSISSINTQPAADTVYAAYRPVALRVTATTNTAGGGPTPPVVYCDIYFAGIFYKTISKTQYSSYHTTNTQWEFDIQDAAQEYLRKYLGTIADSNIVEATTIITEVYCKFRCSGYDADGFILADGTAPVQATSSTSAVAGTGTQSNTFYIVNATLQHQDNQDLATHLTAYKTRTWTAAALPLTQRPDGYALAPDDSDTFPLLMLGTGVPRTLRLNYRYCNQTTFTSTSLNVGPAPQCTAIISDPIAVQNLAGWLVSWSIVSGTPAKYMVSTPTLNGGAPYETTNTFLQLSALAAGTHTITVRPLCLISGTYYFGAIKTVIVTVAACVIVTIEGAPTLPDPVAGSHYHEEIELTGTAPFTITGLTKPGLDWMSVTISGSFIVFDGDPEAGDIDTGLEITVTLGNCGGPAVFVDTIDVVESAPGGSGTVQVGNTMPGISINNIAPMFFTISSGSFPVANGSSVFGVTGAFVGDIGVGITKVGATNGYLRLYIDSVLIECVEVSGSGSYIFEGLALTTDSDVEILLGATPC